MKTSTRFILLFAILIQGCATVRDYDAEKIEFEQVKKISAAQKDPFNSPKTPEHVRVAENDGVYVEAHKGFSTKGPQNIELEVWRAVATNTNDAAKCVSVEWKLQDFEFESDLPSEFLMKPKEKLIIAKMRQTIWSFDGAAIAIPPSGKGAVSVREPTFDKKNKKLECSQDESFIQEPKKDGY